MQFDIVTIVGNRPQFIKMAPLSQELKLRGYKELILHTGQHFDENMSQVFFEELNIPSPDIHLSISGKSHGRMTGEMLIQIEEILLKYMPNGVLIYGDTNSTLAAALAAVKLKIPVAHVESGPRIYDLKTPEEVNRIVADHVSQLRFCPDTISVQNLEKESIIDGVYFTGDLMFDSFVKFSQEALLKSKIINQLNIQHRSYALMTVHRPDNTGSVESLNRIIELIKGTPLDIIFPMHPRTEAAFKQYNLWGEIASLQNIRIISPVGYLDMLELINHSTIVITDSGGLQKEAFFAGKPLVVLYFTTPWPQIEASRWLECCWKGNGIDVERIIDLIKNFSVPTIKPTLFGDGNAAIKIVDILEKEEWLAKERYGSC